jgi:hypothetical protein
MSELLTYKSCFFQFIMDMTREGLNDVSEITSHLYRLQNDVLMNKIY